MDAIAITKFDDWGWGCSEKQDSNGNHKVCMGDVILSE